MLAFSSLTRFGTVHGARQHPFDNLLGWKLHPQGEIFLVLF